MLAGVTLSFESSYKMGLSAWGSYSEANFSFRYVVLANLSIWPPSFCPALPDFKSLSLIWTKTSLTQGICIWQTFGRFVAMREGVLHHKIKQQRPCSWHWRDPCAQESFDHFSLAAILVSHFPIILCPPSLSSLSYLPLKLQFLSTSLSRLFCFCFSFISLASSEYVFMYSPKAIC